MAVYLDTAAADIIETHQKLHHGRLACPGRAYDSHRLPGFYLAAEIIDDDFIGIVTEMDVFK